MKGLMEPSKSENGFTPVVEGKRKNSNKFASVSKKKRKAHFSSVSTAEELTKLQDEADMFHSNIFKMQVDEMLKEFNTHETEKDSIADWIKQLNSLIKNLPETDQYLINDFELPNTTKVPIMMTPANIKGTFKFVPPTSINIIGSYLLGAVCSTNPTIDIAVEIPKSCWQGMDFLNYRYHRKRALYIAYIASFLKDAEFVKELSFEYQNGCSLKPVIMITPKGLSKVHFCLTAYPNMDSFKTGRFEHSKNNVRSTWHQNDAEDCDQPTPLYNASVLSDLLLLNLNNFSKEQLSSQNLKDGLILLKLWCKQRGLSKGYGRINGFILSMFVCSLMKKQKLDRSMNAYQVFRTTLLALSSNMWLNGEMSVAEDLSLLKDFKKSYSVVLLDPTGLFNICYSVTKQTCLRIQHEAKLSLSVLDENSQDSFDNLFIKRVNFGEKFEYHIRFRDFAIFERYLKRPEVRAQLLDYGENTSLYVLPKICDLLTKGLNSRVSLLDISQDSIDKWSLQDFPPQPCFGKATIGILLNPEGPLNNLEKGPLADSPEAAAFRDFWGEKSEMRRFQDSTIREAVFWKATTMAEKRKVFPTIIGDILERHCEIKRTDLAIIGTELDCCLRLPKTLESSLSIDYGTGEEAHLEILQSFNDLTKRLRNLSDLPLQVASVQPVSPAFRYSEVFPHVPFSKQTNNLSQKIFGQNEKITEGPVSKFVPALKVIVVLEGSGKWPNDVEVIRKLKAAFHIKLAELFQSQCKLTAVPFLTHADIYKDGYVFRIEVACHKEIYLLKQVKTETGAMRIQENKESRILEISTEILPKLNGVLYGLHQQCSSFGTACRLAKRWISAQLNFGLIQEITIELLVSHIYLHPEPLTRPCSPQTAFIRFLSLLSTYNFASAPLIVNLNNELSAETIEESLSTFASQRASLPSIVIVTPFDTRGSMWTKNQPTALILKRLVILAKASLKTLTNILNGEATQDVKTILRPPISSFDVLIYLRRVRLPRLSCAVDLYEKEKLPQCLPYEKDGPKVYPIVNYNPVENYLAELKANFDDFALFLHDLYGGDFIAVVWKRSAFVPKELTSASANCGKLYGDGKRVIPDVERILEDFQLLGAGLVKTIVKQTQNWQIP